MTKEELKKLEKLEEDCKEESKTLTPCSFCGGKAEFYVSKNERAPLHIRHLPDSGVCCPARFDQYCDNFEQGKSWWNKRSLTT